MKINKYQKRMFKDKYELSLKNMKILVSLLMRRKLMNLKCSKAEYVLAHPDGKVSAVPVDAVSSLVQKGLLSLAQNREQFVLSSLGFDKAHARLQDADGVIYSDRLL